MDAHVPKRAGLVRLIRVRIRNRLLARLLPQAQKSAAARPRFLDCEEQVALLFGVEFADLLYLSVVTQLGNEIVA